ncbi:MAG: lipo-like protein, partial [Burkholderiales bacterium]|nr:lipo-like protein [Burkholderiales bacterium]
MIDAASTWVGTRLGHYLSKARHHHSAGAIEPERLMACLRPGDVLLIDGETRISAAIKYLTQSTWSHAALYTGDPGDARDEQGRPLSFIEADLHAGVRRVSVAEYAGLHGRVCRPVGLSRAEIRALIAFAAAHLGDRYDLKNVIDLARYLLPTPPVPPHWRRHLLALGSGDPTRAICSTLIAEAFQSVRYPILPEIETVDPAHPMCPGCVDEILHVRHHSLFAPRDFDVSPYFAVIKPTLETGFDHRTLTWHEP